MKKTLKRIPGQKSAGDYLAEHRARMREHDVVTSALLGIAGGSMTLDQFDQTLGYLLKVVMPPSVSGADPTPSEILDILMKHAEEVRGTIIRQSLDRAGEGEDKPL